MPSTKAALAVALAMLALTYARSLEEEEEILASLEVKDNFASLEEDFELTSLEDEDDLTRLEEEEEEEKSLEVENRVDSLCSKYGPGHTMCLSIPGPLCGKGKVFTNVGFTDGEKKYMVDYHNEKRRYVAMGKESHLRYKAANMRELKWNDELAKVAQRWADQCSFHHDKKDARLIPAFEAVGQNIYRKLTSRDKYSVNEIAKKSVDSWYSEASSYHGTGENFKFSNSAGHYTQLLWADTDQIGCGLTKYWDRSYKPEYPFKYMVVCNYGIAGNWEGGVMFKHGSPCSACPSGTSCKDNLCA